ncbi:glycosyltransferase family 4 protein [Nocardioides campestrisoli]|uniref:glycosyltransferase family 4 protein n=1 Tax=Nocardioides campestrisoli TaxID=2736757 RepID=UPI00163D8660|nr:glycosyltransferase family 4 protein [Nocardioides campestrisoli]
MHQSLVVLASPATVGAGVYIYWQRMAPALTELGWQVTILTPGSPGSSTPELNLRPAAIRWIRTDLRKHLEQTQATHLITSIPQSDILVHYGLGRPTIPWFTFAHGQPFPVMGQANPVKSRLWREAWINSARASDGILAVSRELATQVGAWTRIPVQVVGPCLKEATPQFGKTIEPPLHVAFVGRLSYEKDPLLFGAIAQASRDLPATFHVYGDGPLGTELRREFPFMTFHGHTQDMLSAYKKMHVLLMTSRSEGLGMVSLEASQSAVAPLVAGVGGAGETIHPDLHSRLIVPNKQRGNVIQWRERIQWLAEAENWSRVTAMQAQYVATTFDPSSAATRLSQALLNA